ncbi:MAG TPA: HAMP domain-containing sensor histidine kinase [Devosia sp.]|jgi:signal transduction histidine kinase|uniref:sensor histidine kinase n=1 Tax=Devosia sp. TaxID=1871048 RepID=UPI002DDCB23F|nr:HAMP domain-containing sensor histidine kinase [Devosia sp.]HEV2515749.1 HAMP domain-containing sensor histidine kinase [Devosia sp.]
MRRLLELLGFPWTIRTRLSLLYAGAFFVAGVALIVAIYLYLGVVLDRQFSIRLVNDAAPNAEGQLGAPGVLPPRDLMDEAGRISVLVRQARLNTLDTMLMVSLALVGFLTILAGVIGWLVAGQALRPLRDITATARRVADRSLHERIALAGPNDEIKDLADTLDQMLERLDRSFDSQRRFVANASHELRTPLTITRTLIEVALLDAAADDKLRQLGTTLLAVNQRHEKLTDGLLTLASGEQRAAQFHAVELGEIAGHIVTELTPVAERAGIRLGTAFGRGTVMGDAFLLERLIQNLIENAIQYNISENGWVSIHTTTNGNSVELVVENTGPVVPTYEIPSLFEPFRRLATTERLAGTTRAAITRGAGLGLSIVRSVAHTHGGGVEASPREGGGLVVRVRFPGA